MSDVCGDPPVVVVGAGPVGMHVAESLAQQGPVLVIDADSASPDGTENRINFLRSVGRRQNHATAWHGKKEYHPHLVFWKGKRVVALRRDLRKVFLEDGHSICYSNLVLALGAAPLVPEFVDQQVRGLQNAYSQDDFAAIRNAVYRRESITIVGGGLIAVELAATLAGRTQVRLIVRGRLLGKYANVRIADLVSRHLRSEGVSIEEGCEVDSLEYGSSMTAIRLRDGRSLSTDRAVLACGMRPRVALAESSGLSAANGICVDEMMRTSDTHIFAVGDCAQPRSPWGRGNVAAGIQDAEKAVLCLHGGAVRKRTDVEMPERRIEVGELLFVSKCGNFNACAIRSERITRQWRSQGYSLVIEDRRIVECHGVLTKPSAIRLSQLAQRHVDIRWSMRVCLKAGIVPRVRSARDPIICHCAGVTCDEAVQAAATDGDSLDAVMSLTGAGQYCGTCAEQLSSLIEARPAKRSSRTLCLAAFAGASAVLAASWPTMGAGIDVQSLWFKTYSFMMNDSVRQASGYVGVLFVALSLTAVGKPPSLTTGRRRSQHAIYGTLSLGILPMHVLGGITVGSGLNALLLAPFLVCVTLGVIVLLKRSLRTILWLHAAVTIILLATVAIHVVHVYQY